MPNLNQKGLTPIILIIILILGIAFTVYGVQYGRTIFRSKASFDQTAINEGVAEMTVKLNSSLIDNSDVSSEELATIASKRYEKLQEIALNDPASFLKLATLAEKNIDRVSEDIRKYIERDVRFNGVIRASYLDYSDNSSKAVYTINKSNSDNTELMEANEEIYFVSLVSKEGSDTLNNVLVQGKGVSIGSYLVVDNTSADFQVQSNADVSGGQRPPPDKLKIAVITWSLGGGYHPQRFNLDDIKDYVFGDSESLKEYFYLNSLKKVVLTGDIIEDVYGLYVFPPGECSPSLQENDYKYLSRLRKYVWDSVADYKKRYGVDLFKQYDRLLFVNDTDWSCTGIRGIGGLYGEPWAAMHFDPTDLNSGWLSDESVNPKIAFLRLAMHELGHTFGLGHASFMQCTDKKGLLVYGKDCQFYGNDDNSDPMNYHDFEAPFFNSVHMEQLGWVSSDQIKEVTQGGTYRLSALENNISGEDITKILKIRKPNSDSLGLFKDSKAYYYVSFRQPVDNWNLWPNGKFFNQGASIHWNKQISLPVSIQNLVMGGDVEQETVLIGASMGRGGLVLVDNVPFDDRTNYIRITQLDHNENSVIVKVEFYDVQ